jgi:glycerol-3-phosphate acyltransferase PlsY
MIGVVGLLAFGYLLGALPFTVALALAHGLDPAVERDVHIALRREVGWLAAVAAVVVDLAKGVFPVLVGFGFSLPVWGVSLAGVAAVGGQMWPPLRGIGEKGNSTGVGVLIALSLVFESYYVLLSLLFFATGALFRLTMLGSASPDRRSPDHVLSLALPLGMLLGFCAAPALAYLTGQPPGLTAGLLLTMIAIVVRRLTAGLREDLSVGVRMGPVLIRRLLFDQPLTGRDW